MPAPSLYDLAAKLKETYAEMEHQRKGSLLNSGVSSAVSFLSLGFVEGPMTFKTPKLDALANAKTPTEITLALKALKEDKDFIESTSLKNIVDIYDHCWHASQARYANTAMDLQALSTPAEAAQDAIDELTTTYHVQFVNVANRAEFLRMATLFLREQLKIETQNAIDKVRAEEKLQAQTAIDTVRAEEKLKKQLEIASTKANAMLAKKIDERVALKKANLEKVAAVDAQLVRAIDEIEQTEARYKLQLEKNKAETKEDHERTFRLATNIQIEYNKEVDNHSKTASELSELKHDHAFLTVEAKNARNEASKLKSELGLAREELRWTQEAKACEVKKLKDTTFSLTTITTQLTEKENVIKQLEEYLAKQETAIRQLEEELAAAKQKQMQDTARINAEVKSNRHLRDENTTLKHQKVGLSAQKQLLEEEIITQQSVIASQQKQLEEQVEKTNNSAMAKELQSEKAVSEHIKEAYSKAENYIDHLQSQLRSLKGTLEDTIEKNSALRKQITDLTTQVEKSRLSTSASVYTNRFNTPKQQTQNQQQTNDHNQPPYRYKKIGS